MPRSAANYEILPATAGCMHAGVDLGVERLAQTRRCHHDVWGTRGDDATFAQKKDTRRQMRGRVELVHRDDAREAVAGGNLGE
jgi:hypothetical protein